MISIIIPIYILDEEIKKLTENCIKSIKDTTEDYEIIVVDNASPVKFPADIVNKENKGNAVAWNQGLEKAKGDYLVLCDNDVEVKKGWTVMTEYADNAIVFPKSKLGDDNYYGERLAGFFWMMSRETFEKLGYVSEEYGIANFEDTDYFMRAQENGVKLLTSPAKVWHKGRATCEKVPEVNEIYYKNENYYKRKWKKFPNLNK